MLFLQITLIWEVAYIVSDEWEKEREGEGDRETYTDKDLEKLPNI